MVDGLGVSDAAVARALREHTTELRTLRDLAPLQFFTATLTTTASSAQAARTTSAACAVAVGAVDVAARLSAPSPLAILVVPSSAFWAGASAGLGRTAVPSSAVESALTNVDCLCQACFAVLDGSRMQRCGCRRVIVCRDCAESEEGAALLARGCGVEGVAAIASRVSKTASFPFVKVLAPSGADVVVSADLSVVYLDLWCVPAIADAAAAAGVGPSAVADCSRELAAALRKEVDAFLSSNVSGVHGRAPLALRRGGALDLPRRGGEGGGR